MIYGCTFKVYIWYWAVLIQFGNGFALQRNHVSRYLAKNMSHSKIPNNPFITY